MTQINTNPYDAYIALIKFFCEEGYINRDKVSSINPIDCFAIKDGKQKGQQVAIPTKFLTDFIEKELGITQEFKLCGNSNG